MDGDELIHERERPTMTALVLRERTRHLPQDTHMTAGRPDAADRALDASAPPRRDVASKLVVLTLASSKARSFGPAVVSGDERTFLSAVADCRPLASHSAKSRSYSARLSAVPYFPR